MAYKYNNSLSINTDQLRKLIDQYKKERDNLVTILSNYNNDIKVMNDYWCGDNGDEASSRLKK